MKEGGGGARRPFRKMNVILVGPCDFLRYMEGGDRNGKYGVVAANPATKPPSLPPSRPPFEHFEEAVGSMTEMGFGRYYDFEDIELTESNRVEVVI